MLIKTLSRLGNSSAIVVDRALMELMDIDDQTPLKLVVEGRKLIVEPLSDEERAKKFGKILKKTGKKNAKLFASLAK